MNKWYVLDLIFFILVSFILSTLSAIITGAKFLVGIHIFNKADSDCHSDCTLGGKRGLTIGNEIGLRRE